MAGGASPDEIAQLFSPDLDWHIAGDEGVLPWIGHKVGRGAIADFVRDSRIMLERINFEVHDVLTGNSRAVILGSLASKLNRTGKVIRTDYVIILTVADGQVTRFQMLEDSFAVSKAARSLDTI
jgi:ketosteroid isomerase-like protein